MSDTFGEYSWAVRTYECGPDGAATMAWQGLHDSQRAAGGWKIDFSHKEQEIQER